MDTSCKNTEFEYSNVSLVIDSRSSDPDEVRRLVDQLRALTCEVGCERMVAVCDIASIFKSEVIWVVIGAADLCKIIFV